MYMWDYKYNENRGCHELVAVHKLDVVMRELEEEEEVSMFGKSVDKRTELSEDGHIDVTKIDNGFLVTIDLEDKEDPSPGYTSHKIVRKFFPTLNEICDHLKDNYK